MSVMLKGEKTAHLIVHTPEIFILANAHSQVSQRTLITALGNWTNIVALMRWSRCNLSPTSECELQYTLSPEGLLGCYNA